MPPVYRGRHAELYALFYAEKPYRQEATFVAGQLREHGVAPPARLLDLACGTGEHAFFLEADGYAVTGVDSSPSMLACARRKRQDRDSQVRFVEQDMCALSLPERFAAAVCLFDSIGFAGTNEGVRATLAGVARHLDPDGIFVLEFWHAPALLLLAERVRVRRLAGPDGEILRIAETTIDAVRGLGEVRYTIYEHREDGSYSKLEEVQRNRFFLVEEMAAHLDAAGFQPLAWYGALADQPVTPQSFHAVCVARSRRA